MKKYKVNEYVLTYIIQYTVQYIYYTIYSTYMFSSFFAIKSRMFTTNINSYKWTVHQKPLPLNKYWANTVGGVRGVARRMPPIQYGILTQLKQISCRAATAEVTVECDKWCIDSHNYSSQHCTFRLVHGMFTSENTICYPPSSRMRILAYRKPLHVQCL